MAPRRILTWPDERLRALATPVERVDDEVRVLVRDLFETMYEAGGVGLAATQVGVTQRVVVVDCGLREPVDPAPRPIALINPQIVAREDVVIWREGCLSLPGITAEVERSAKIEVEYQDADGAPQRLAAGGLLAVCIQHELDHLEGQLYVDRLGALERKATLVEYAKLSAEEQAAVVG